MCNYEKAGEVAHAIVQSESSKCQPSVQVAIFFENDKKLEWHDPPRFGVSQCALPQNCPSATWLARGQLVDTFDWCRATTQQSPRGLQWSRE